MSLMIQLILVGRLCQQIALLKLLIHVGDIALSVWNTTSSILIVEARIHPILYHGEVLFDDLWVTRVV